MQYIFHRIYFSSFSQLIQQTSGSNALSCSQATCMGSIMHGANFPLITSEVRKPDTVLEHAKDFLDQYFTSIRR